VPTHGGVSFTVSLITSSRILSPSTIIHPSRLPNDRLPCACGISKRPANVSTTIADTPLPPPPSFSAREMPPLSSPQMPQAQHISHATSSRGPNLIASFPASRDLPHATSINRPESSMSISSMLGSDPTRPSRELVSRAPSSDRSPNGISALSSPRIPTGSAPSPSRTRDHGSSLYQRSRSPERAMFANSHTSRPVRTFSGGASRPQIPSVNVGSSEFLRFNASSGPFNPHYSPKSETSPALNDGRPILKRPHDRPNSQPIDSLNRSLEFDKSLHLRPATSEAESFGPVHTKHFEGAKVAEGPTENLQQGREDSAANGYGDLRTRHALERQTMQPASQESPAPKVVSGSTYPFSPKGIPPSPERARTHRETDPLGSRVVEREQSAPSQSPYTSESIRRLRDERLLAPGLPQPLPTLAPSNIPSHLSQVNETPRHHISQGSSTGPGPDIPRGQEQPVKADEDNFQNHRSSLALLVDNSRRGRISPLPQAVQGAQARVNGPASDPGIKSEFARMFIGIGSGVGRAGRLGSGTPTPFSPSPTKNTESGRKTPLVGRGEQVELTHSWAGSKGGRKGRKAKDEEQQRPELDVKRTESISGIISGRGVKRTRHSHHHHPHQHSHQ
jgi:hypothetical protein